jgi:hypothetical protein
MSDAVLFKILAAASEHSERLKLDILLCKTRDEHVRMTARANEAENIVNELKFFMETASE